MDHQQEWHVEVFIEANGVPRVDSVTIEADSEEEAVRRAIAEISRALRFLEPLAKVTGARAKRI